MQNANINYFPPQAAPANRGNYFASVIAFSEGINPSGGGTCKCEKEYAEPCDTKTDNCKEGFYAVCTGDSYGCGCQCKPIS